MLFTNPQTESLNWLTREQEEEKFTALRAFAYAFDAYEGSGIAYCDPQIWSQVEVTGVWSLWATKPWSHWATGCRSE